MKKYEVMYIIRPELDEDAKKALVEEINNVFVNKDSAVEKVDEWGLRDLAYEIKGCTKGYYVVLNVNATPEAIDEFTRVANIKENIIRYIAVAE
jgi:small subunit ribosomal protein S6